MIEVERLGQRNDAAGDCGDGDARFAARARRKRCLTRVRDEQLVANLPAGRIGVERDGARAGEQVAREQRPRGFRGADPGLTAEIQQPVAPLKRIAQRVDG